MTNKKITKVKDLTGAEYNPRQITDEQLESLSRSLKEFGDLSGVVFNANTGNLVGGHQRIKALDPSWKIEKKAVNDNLGTTFEGSIITDFGKLSYRQVDWSLEKEKLANISANKNGGEWDYLKLQELVKELDSLDSDLALSGFNDQELNEMLLDFEEDETVDYSDKNKEIDLDEFEDKMLLKLFFNKDDYLEIQDKFNVFKDKFNVFNNEDVLKELFLLAERSA